MATFLVTAVFADRYAVAAPAAQQRAHVGEVAKRLASRLVVHFRRTVPAARLYAFQRGQPAALPMRIEAANEGELIEPFEVSPFQFRLPPPAL